MTALALAFCLVTSFLFSGTEAGILSLNRVRLRHRLKMNDRAARKLQRLVSHPERMLVTVLLVTNLMNICAILLVTQRVRAVMGDGRVRGRRGDLPAGVAILPRAAAEVAVPALSLPLAGGALGDAAAGGPRRSRRCWRWEGCFCGSRRGSRRSASSSPRARTSGTSPSRASARGRCCRSSGR